MKKKLTLSYFPLVFFQLYENKELNAEETMLLAKINMMQNLEKGCFASNRWLGKWWGKHPTWVSKAINKFKKMGLVEVKLFTKGKNRTVRQVWIRSLIDETTPQTKVQDPHRQKCKTPLKEKCKQLRDTSYHYKSKNNTELRVRGAHNGSSGAFFENGKEDAESPISKLCKLYQNFIITKRLHLGKKKPNIAKWKRACSELKDSLDGDLPRISKVLSWYFLNWKNPWVTHCHAMPTFCQNFHKIEKAMLRDTGASVPEETIKVYRAGIDDEEMERDLCSSGVRVSVDDPDDV